MKHAEYEEELSRCVRCGSCKAYCPTYDEGLTEAMAARGRLTLLRGLLTHQLKPSPLLSERIFSCIQCGACEKLCPPGLHIMEMMYHARTLLKFADQKTRYLAPLIRFLVKRPQLGFKAARILNPFVHTFLAQRDILPFPLLLPNAPLRDDQQVYKPERKIGRVALFTGCSINYLLPSLGISLINILVHLGYEVVLPKGEVCCGAPLRSLGMEDEAAALAKKNLTIFSRLNAEAVLSLCPTCVLSLKHHYPVLAGRGLDHVMDISGFLHDKWDPSHHSPLRNFRKVTYHDPCHLSYSLGIKKEPRDLIQRAGAELVESGDEGCCGFGGTFSLAFRDLSRSLMGKRAAAYRKTGSAAVITACPGCMLQLGGGMKDIPVFHLVELLEEAICFGTGIPAIINKVA
jgi:glycolate oxidase iron-sulfur subunit